MINLWNRTPKILHWFNSIKTLHSSVKSNQPKVGRHSKAAKKGNTTIRPNHNNFGSVILNKKVNQPKENTTFVMYLIYAPKNKKLWQDLRFFFWEPQPFVGGNPYILRVHLLAYIHRLAYIKDEKSAYAGFLFFYCKIRGWCKYIRKCFYVFL